MRFLFKVTFFLILLFVAVAYFAPSEQRVQTSGQSYSMLDGLFAVKSAINDMGGFCDRNPQACESGKSFFSNVKDKALEGARISYEFLNEKLGGTSDKGVENQTKTSGEISEELSPNNVPVENMHTGSIKK